jgi:GNAT superfamily N-acetyltransferase
MWSELPDRSIEDKVMYEEYQIVYRDEPEWEIIGGGVRDFNIQQTGDDNYQSLYFILQAPDQEIVGGVIGATYWDWFYLDLLWVKEELRRRGFGSRLLTIAEDKARQHGAKNVFLDTFSFQAPEFYKQHGYEMFGELQDFPPGHKRYYFSKQL